MNEALLDLGAELLATLLYVAGTLALSALGVAAEYNGLQQLLGGDQLLAAWYAYVGVVALAFGATLLREKVLPRLAGRDQSA
ncbi:hypothetical protein [Halorussus amylolyticus]|uniref:hypothetical protein n=1 Tax=Halorussus amylolyticus TaxID=1126242 RepID=UPI00104EA143|nr:hypothetical protein [Halorussus amylolyticus]